MKWVTGAPLIGDLTLSPLPQPLTVILAPRRDAPNGIDRLVFLPTPITQDSLSRLSGAEEKSCCNTEHSRRSISSSVCERASCQSRDTKAYVFVCVCACVCIRGCKGGYITAMLLSNCLLLSLVTTMTSVIGISAFCLHCRASTTLLAAFSLPRAARPMPHKYKHNLSYTS